MTLHQASAFILALTLTLFAHAPATAQQGAAPDALRETFRDWTVQCAKRKDQSRECEMLQQVDHEESRNSVLLFSIRINEQDQPVSVMITPFGLLLSEGVQLVVGETVVGRYGFQTCLNNGCIVIAELDKSDIATMRAGAEGQLRAITRNGEGFGIPVSFWGFSAALDRLLELDKG